MRCAVKFCRSTKYNRRGTSLHKFPKSLKLQKEWLEAIGMPNMKVDEYSVICTKHFETQSIIKLTSRARLTDTAIPKLHLKLGSERQYTVKCDNPTSDKNGDLFEDSSMTQKDSLDSNDKSSKALQSILSKWRPALPILPSANLESSFPKPTDVETQNTNPAITRLIYIRCNCTQESSRDEKASDSLVTSCLTINSPPNLTESLKLPTTRVTITEQTLSKSANENEKFGKPIAKKNHTEIIHLSNDATMDQSDCFSNVSNTESDGDNDDDELRELEEEIERLESRIYSDADDVQAKELEKENTPSTEKVPVMECSICRAVFWDHKEAKEHENVHINEKIHRCHICQKVSTTKSNLLIHLRTHESATFDCKLCGKKYAGEDGLRRHIRTIHEGIRKYICKICGRDFPRSANLRIHEAVHSTERNFKCDVCGKRYKTKEALGTHTIHVHKGKPRPGTQKLLKCQQCNYQTYYLNSFHYHVRKHNDAKPQKCEYCEKIFDNTQKLRSHVRLHTTGKPYKCESCDFSFRRRSYLARHRLTHTREKRHKCLYCKRAFATAHDKNRHALIHKRENPLMCEQCKKVFTGKRALWKHKRTEHGNEGERITDD